MSACGSFARASLQTRILIIGLVSAAVLFTGKEVLLMKEKQHILHWFDEDATNLLRSTKQHMLNHLHLGSGWNYLSKLEFAEFTLFPLRCLSPEIKNGDSVFEFGVGTGGAMNV
jgi:hypothetical protein